MKRLAALPGWVLVVVWIAVPVTAVALLVESVRSDDEPAVGRAGLLGSTGIDVQTAELRRQRVEQGIADCSGLPTARSPAADGLPALQLPCLGGRGTVDLATLRGPAVLNVWAQSCAGCREEMPLFQRLHARAAGLTVLGVDYLDFQPERAIAFAGRVGVTYPSVADVDDELGPALRLTGLPTTLFVDAQGRLVAAEARTFTSYAELVGVVEEHLGVGG